MTHVGEREGLLATAWLTAHGIGWSWATRAPNHRAGHG